MLFIWTSEGGPLQYLGLAIFLLQILPQVLPDVTQTTNQQRALAGGLGFGILAVLLWSFGNRQRVSQWIQQAQARFLQGRQWSYYALPAVLGVILGCAFTLMPTMELMRWLPYVGQLITMLSVLGVGRGPQHGQAHVNRQNEAARQAKLEEMSALGGLDVVTPR